jgi:signal transduction histidine kinase
VLADRVQIQQVLLNLILNGVEAMKGAVGARELTVRTRPATSGCEVTVIDTGPGVSPDHVDRLFDAFFTTKPGGTGMGLPICRSIVESHGGKLWLEPGGEGVGGCAFRFTIPAGGEEGA